MAKKAAKSAVKNAESSAVEKESRRSAWPFFIALGAVVLLVAGVGASYLFRPAEERAGDSAQVQYAINKLYTARNSVDYAAYREHTCVADLASQQFITEQAFVAENTPRRDNPIQIPEITDLKVDGNRARAQVHWHFKDTADQVRKTPTIVVRENGEWKVCSS